MHIDYRNLRRIRKERGLQLKDVAAACGYSLSRLSMYETGYRRPPSDVLIHLLEFYGTTHEQLLVNKNKDRID